jgi:GT2 family glycosyltransferase
VARTRFLLFTQPDAWFGADAIRLAVGLSLALAAEPSGGGRPAVVGPSGGYVPSWAPVFTEEGRNVERFGDPVPVEWVGGYWMLAERAAWREVGGMWNRSFLYCEEPDVCLRLAAEGARSFVWGDLPVNHQRGGTIKRRMLPSQVGEIHDDARREFSRRWGGRRDLGQPKR